MNQLEFDKYLRYIKEECHSLPGIEYLETFGLSSDLNFIKNRLLLISNMQKMVIDGYNYNFEFLVDLALLFSEMKTLTFNFEEFRSIIFSLKIANQIFIDQDNFDEYSSFKNYIQNLVYLPLLVQKYHQIFDDDGNTLDSASLELKSIRQKIRNLKERIHNQLQITLNNNLLATYFQEKIITKRDERFVIPVKENFAYMVKGLAHGKSSSGSTIYIEPEIIVHLNNDLNILISDEKTEIFKIYCQFTAEIHEYEQSILTNYELMKELDTYFACARISNSLHAIVPEIVTDNVIELKRARHPLLVLKNKSLHKVIPFDLSLGTDFKVLLLSGPNTGGKTITLKTVGLCTMLVLTGLPIPVDYGSKIGLISNIYADIGDHQSIESSLSTFSGHMQSMKEIINGANANSLVLIDEIGSATDPEQGSALAQAILEQLLEKQALAIVTTHYTSLKVFAERNTLCVNASMQFDDQKLEPTYQLNLGFPGHSFAIEVAETLGIDQTLIQRAKELTGSQSIELTELINKMNHEKKEYATLSYQMKLKTHLLEQRTKDLEIKLQQWETEKKRIAKETLLDSQEFLTNIQKQINNEIIEMKNLQKEEKKKQLRKITMDIQTHQKNIMDRLTTVFPTASTNGVLAIGDDVWIKTFDSEAKIVDINKNMYKVETNGIFYQVEKSVLVKLEHQKTNETGAQITRKNIEFMNNAKFEINLIGQTYEEALPKIEDLIDQALFYGLNKIRVIHGRGTGILRKKIRDYLKKNQKVLDFFSPPHETGGDGVTVIVVGK